MKNIEYKREVLDYARKILDDNIRLSNLIGERQSSFVPTTRKEVLEKSLEEAENKSIKKLSHRRRIIEEITNQSATGLLFYKAFEHLYNIDYH